MIRFHPLITVHFCSAFLFHEDDRQNGESNGGYICSTSVFYAMRFYCYKMSDRVRFQPHVQFLVSKASVFHSRKRASPI